MGRGRAKAKQTKVARELKYSSHGTDLDALRAELTGSRAAGPDHHDDVAKGDDDYVDPYAAYEEGDAEDADDDEDDDA